MSELGRSANPIGPRANGRLLLLAGRPGVPPRPSHRRRDRPGGPVIRRALAAGLAVALAAVGVVAVAPQAAADTTRAQTTNFRCAQTLYSGTYQPAATSVHTLTYTVSSSAPVGGSVNVERILQPRPAQRAAGAQRGDGHRARRVPGLQERGRPAGRDRDGRQLRAPVPGGLRARCRAAATVAAYPSAGAASATSFEFVPVAFRIDLTGGDADPLAARFAASRSTRPIPTSQSPRARCAPTIGTSAARDWRARVQRRTAARSRRLPTRLAPPPKTSR